MKYLHLFDDFNKVDESYNFDNDSLLESKINQMNSLRENCMAAWDISMFKDFFSAFLNEGYSEDESLMEKAYCTYELGILYEHKNEWFNSPGEISYLEDFESDIPRAILFKNNGIHIITGETLKSLKEGLDLLNEGWMSDLGSFMGKAKDKVSGAWKKYVKEPVKKATAWVGDKVSKAWNALSSGAKEVWEFSKKIISAAAVFIKENPLTALGLALQIIGALVENVPAFGTAAKGILLAIAGGITIYEGVTGLIDAIKETSGGKKVSDIVKGGAKIVFGCASLILGIKDLIGVIGDALPGFGAVGVSIKTSVLKWSDDFAKTAFGSVATVGVGKTLGCSKWLGSFFETLCEKAPFMAKVSNKYAKKGIEAAIKGVDAGIDKGKEAVLDHNEYVDHWDESINEDEGEWGFVDLLINFMVYIGKSCFSWLYDKLIAGISGVGKAINFLMDLPGKITKGIDTFKKEHGGSFVGGILSGALSSVVKPLSSCSQRFIDEYIKPKIKPVSGWMEKLGKRSADISKKIESNKDLKSPVPGIKEQGPPKIVPKKIDISDKDKSLIKKIGTSGTSTLVKAGGGSEKILEKIKKAQGEFKKKFPGVSKLKGTWGQSPSGKATYTIKSKEADGSVTLFNDGKYTVISGPNKKSRGEFKAEDKFKLIEPKGGWKKNESRNYIRTFEGFSFG